MTTGFSNREIERRIFDLVTGACTVNINKTGFGRSVVVMLPEHESMYLLTMRDGEEEKVLADFTQDTAGMFQLAEDQPHG